MSRNPLDDLIHGHIRIEQLNIDYQLPESVTSYHHWKNRIMIWIGAAIVGLVAIGFAHVCDWAAEFFRNFVQDRLWLSAIITPLGLVAVRLLTQSVFRGSEGSGIPQVIAAVSTTNRNIRRALLSYTVLVGKLLGTTLGLLCGASIGREGPTVQIGAILLRKFGVLLKAPYHYSNRSLILAGGAAGVSAAFNTPLAGIVFAIEELSKSFIAKETSVLLMAVIMAGLTALSISGNYFYFGQHVATLAPADNFYAIPVGLGGGLLGGLFGIIIIHATKAMSSYSPTRALVRTATLGFAIAILGIISDGHSFGTGYEEARMILESPKADISPWFGFSKFMATIFSYMTGIPGGVFSPSLSIGAGVGAFFAKLFPAVPYVPFVLMGMVAFFSGVIRAPITAVVIVAEMTDEHAMLLPLMLASVVAYGLSNAMGQGSIYGILAERYLPQDQKG